MDDQPLTVLLIGPPRHGLLAALSSQLTAAGRPVASSANVYQAVVKLAGRPHDFAVAALAVDYCTPQELRFFSLSRRRWPHLKTVALAQPAFAHKVALAELAGADLVALSPEQLADLAAKLKLTGPAPAAAVALPAALSAGSRTIAVEIVSPKLKPSPERPPATRLPITTLPDAPAAVPEQTDPGLHLPTGSSVLTEEEISALMADFEDDEDGDSLSRGTPGLPSSPRSPGTRRSPGSPGPSGSPPSSGGRHD